MSSAGGSRKRRRKNPDPEPVPEIPADDDYENAAVDYGDEYGGTQPVVEGQQQYGGGSRVVVQVYLRFPSPHTHTQDNTHHTLTIHIRERNL